MVTCMGDVHIWSCKDQTIIPDEDIGCLIYHDKKELGSSDHRYIEEKANYIESRNLTWIQKNKRPEKLKDTLKEVEDLLVANKCIKSRWMSRKVIQLVLSNGAVISIVLRIHAGDIDKIFIDKSLVGKLSAESPCDALVTDNYLVFAYPNHAKLDFVHLSRKSIHDPSKKYEKISSCEPRISQVEIPGPVGRRLHRNLACNLHHDVVIVWWSTSSDEAWPWSPMTGDRDRANLVLTAVNGPNLELLAYSRTDGDPVDVTYSLLRPHQILVVERSKSATSEFCADNAVYEYNRGKIQKVSAVSIPLEGKLLSCGRDMSEDKLVLGCERGKLVLYDQHRKASRPAKSSLTPNFVAWHPSGSVLVIGGQRGEIQVFDMALNALQMQLVSEEPSPVSKLELGVYFRSPSTVRHLLWSPLMENSEYVLPECNDTIFIMFDRGPMVALQYYLGIMRQGQLTPLSLVNQYIKYRQLDEAIGVLLGLNWNIEGQMSYACLSAVVTHLLRMSLTPEREGQLETSLGTFYTPVRPLNESTVLEFRDSISRFARRFFHHLLRFSRFEKAFLLAIDIGARDLFMDIHYIAKDKGELRLAEAARRKALEIDSDSFGTDSLDSDVTEESEDSLDYSDDDLAALSHDQVPAYHYAPQAYGKFDAPHAVMCTGAPPSLPDPRFVHRMPAQIPEISWNSAHFAMPELALQQLEAELASELVNEYTETLVNDPMYPPPLGRGWQQNPKEQNNDTKKSTRVIHLGRV